MNPYLLNTYTAAGPVITTTHPHNQYESDTKADESTYKVIDHANFENVELHPTLPPCILPAVTPPTSTKHIGTEPCAAYGLVRR